MEDTERVAAVILAAGRSSRMGTPKALLRVGEETFLERIVRTAVDAALSPVLVVTRDGIGGDTMGAASPTRSSDPGSEPQALRIVNPEPDRGQLSSLRCGLRALPPTTCAAAVFLVDHPLVRPQTVRRLVDAIDSRTPHELRGSIVVPAFRGRRGHPVVFSRAVFGELLEGPEEGGARRVVRADPGRVAEIEVDDPGVVADIDTPEDYSGWIRSRAAQEVGE